MELTGTYKQILGLSLPIMIGSAAQQIIALSDSVFLLQKSTEDFAAIGFVGVFYLVVAAIGYGFSKGGQIMIARRMGEGDMEGVGGSFRAMLAFEVLLAILLFLFIVFICPTLFDYLIVSDVILEKSLAYLDYRSYGVFFSFSGMSIIALYTGVARPWFIIVDTIILGGLNLILNYGLIFGALGLPEMGIAGAGLASTIAEVIAFIVFVIYIFFDKKARGYKLLRGKIDLQLIKNQVSIAAPVVAQSVIGLGSWVIFFATIENLGERSLAITNFVRMIYLVLSVPVWGYSSGINTLTSSCIGQGKDDMVMPMTWKTSWLAFLTTALMTIPVLIFPETLLSPLFLFSSSETDATLITDSISCLYVLGGILVCYCFGAIFFNSVSGTGATFKGLLIQFVCVIFYLGYIKITIPYLGWGLEWGWAGEIFYWIIMWLATYWYLKRGNWKDIKL